MRNKNSAIDFEAKYKDLRARFINALDLSYRQGYEGGYNQANQEAAQQQVQQAQASMQQMQGQIQQAQQAQGGMPEGMPQQEEQQADPSAQPQEGADAAGTELDQLIGELEGLVNKSDISQDDLKKSIEKLKSNRLHVSLAKSIRNTGKIGRTNSKGLFKSQPVQTSQPMSQSYTNNLSSNDKKAVAMQQQIIKNIFNKWENESSDTGNKIAQSLSTEALTKKE